MKIVGRVAAVVGAAQGLGKAYCYALLHKGAKVCIQHVVFDINLAHTVYDMYTHDGGCGVLQIGTLYIYTGSKWRGQSAKVSSA